MLNKTLLTPKELGEMLSVKTSSLAIWRCKETYPLPYIKVGGLIRYELEEVKKWLDLNRKNSEVANDK